MRPLALVLLVLAAPLAAQDPPDLPPNTEPFEVELFRAVYDVEAPILVVPMRVVNDTAYPVYAGFVPALALGAALGDGDYGPALRMGTAQALNFATTFALKRLIARPRPYVALDGVEARDRGHQGDRIFDPYSFPSGHTSTAAVLATSLAISYPEWYVVAPAALWAGTMGAARIWHGVHYPADVAVGAALGVATAVAVHVVWDAVDAGGSEGAAVRFVVPL